MYDLHIDRAQLGSIIPQKDAKLLRSSALKKHLKKTAQITNHLRNVWQVKDDDAQYHLDGQLDEFDVING